MDLKKEFITNVIIIIYFVFQVIHRNLKFSTNGVTFAKRKKSQILICCCSVLLKTAANIFILNVSTIPNVNHAKIQTRNTKSVKAKKLVSCPITKTTFLFNVYMLTL